jgi:hypothetical protein
LMSSGADAYAVVRTTGSGAAVRKVKKRETQEHNNTREL